MSGAISPSIAVSPAPSGANMEKKMTTAKIAAISLVAVSTLLPTTQAHSAGRYHAQSYVHIDNRTGYSIDVYLDGECIGTVKPYGDSYGYEPGGYHKLTGSAPGIDLSWGPRYATFDGSDYTWILNN